MLHFTLKTSFIDDGLSYQTIEKLTIDSIGVLKTYNTNNISRTNFEGFKPIDNMGAMLEALEYIKTAQRNSKTLQIAERVKTPSGEKLSGRINFNRFKW